MKARTCSFYRRVLLRIVCLALLVPFSSAQKTAYAGGGGFTLAEVSNGFGQTLPHRVAVPDANGLPTPTIVDIRSFDDLVHLTPVNPVMPPTSWPAAAILPTGAPGNHFYYARFERALDFGTVFDGAVAADGRNNLTGRMRVVRVDPFSMQKRVIKGRAFIGGFTYGSVDPADPTQRLLERWVGPGTGGPLNVFDPRGLGFPGTESAISAAHLLVDPRTFVFVPDMDDQLTTHESFPAGVHVQLEFSRGVRSRAGTRLEYPGLASATVGVDALGPEWRFGLGGVFVDPPDGSQEVDPATNVRLAFTEPLQLRHIGPITGFGDPEVSASIGLAAGPINAPLSFPFSLRPVSPFDFTRIVIDPAYDFPNTIDPSVPNSVDFGLITVRLFEIEDLVHNENTLQPTSVFSTQVGPGLVNAPVTPDAIYLARSASAASGSDAVSVLDLNGFGQSTGNPVYDPANPIVEGNSNFPNNPNVVLQGVLFQPPLAPGSTTFDGGSSGVMTLTRNTGLSNVLLSAPNVESVGDMALGHPLDTTFNNGMPFGCQAGGGNICAVTGLKRVSLHVGSGNVPAPPSPGQFPQLTILGNSNLASWAPHPNPPPIIFPPLCTVPFIPAQEPTAIDVVTPVVAGGVGLQNLLTPGPFPFGIPDIGLPPQGLLVLEQNTYINGPSPPQSTLASCFQYGTRQQIGQFLYMTDRTANELVVLNSNRMSVIQRIAIPDPTSLAMSPNLDLLAITSESTDSVYFVHTDPGSAFFHMVGQVVAVGVGPRGVAWEAANEDIFVCNTGAGTVSVISSFNLQVRKTLTSHLTQPIDVATTPRQLGYGLNRGVYYAYILNADGTVAVFESGPSGINGFGFDDVVDVLPFPLDNPKAIQAAPDRLESAFWVLHENALDTNGVPIGLGGAATLIGIVGGPSGITPLLPGELPSLRGVQYGVIHSIGEGPGGLTGIPVDLAFDNQRNLSAYPNFSTQFTSFNGKSLVKSVEGGIRPVSAPHFMFLAVPASSEGPGVVDVIDLLSGTPTRFDVNVFEDGVQSIAAPGVRGLADYFRQ